MSASPAPAVLSTRAGTPGTSAFSSPRSSAPSGPSVITASLAPASTKALAARSGSLSPVISAASATVARTRSAPGTHVFAAAAASAGEGHR